MSWGLGGTEVEAKDVIGSGAPLDREAPEAEAPATVNRRAARALSLWWIPGFGIVAGRKALKEIRWTGEQGRDKAVRAIIVNSVVTAVLAAGLLAANLSGNSGTTQVTAFHLDPGQCYENTGKTVLDRKVYARVEVVRTTACGQPHDGEVVSTWDTAETWRDHPSDDVLDDRVKGECYKRLTGYAADLWALPEHLKLMSLYLTGVSYLGRGDRPAVCLLQGDGTEKLSLPLRQDPAGRTPAQTTYLTAVNAYEVALSARPQGDNALIDPTGWKQYASGMAAAARRERDALRAGSWTGAAGAAVSVVEADAGHAAADWERASGSRDPGVIDRYCGAAAADAPESAARAARRALGLAAGDAPLLA